MKFILLEILNRKFINTTQKIKLWAFPATKQQFISKIHYVFAPPTLFQTKSPELYEDIVCEGK